MARNLYGATSADFTLTSGGRVVPGATLTIWSARTGGTQITDLLDRDSVAATTVTSAADGSVVYYGPNNDKTVHWADSGQGARVAIRPVDITGDPPVMSIGTVTTGAAAAALTGTSEAPVLNLTLPSAGANGVDTNAIQSKAVTAAKIADDTITAAQIAANAVGASELADNAVNVAALDADDLGNGLVLTADSGEPSGMKWSAYGIADLDIGTVDTGTPAAASMTGNPQDGYALNLTLPPVGNGSISNIAVAADADIDPSKIAGTALTRDLVTVDEANGNAMIAGGLGNAVTVVAERATSPISAHVEGYSTEAQGWYGHAEGAGSLAEGKISHAEGNNTICAANDSHAEGNMTATGRRQYLVESTGSEDAGDSLGVLQFVVLPATEGDVTSFFPNPLTDDVTGRYGAGAQLDVKGNVYASGHTPAVWTGNVPTTVNDLQWAMHSVMLLRDTSESKPVFASIAKAVYAGSKTKVYYLGAKPFATIGYVYGAYSPAVLGGGNGQHAEGNQTSTSGYSAHAEGYITKAWGLGAHAEGRQTKAAADYGPHAEGYLTAASGYSAHAEGKSTIASGENSHAEGDTTTASGTGSHAENVSTVASGPGSHAEGGGTTASGDYSHSEGLNTLASGYAASARGYKSAATRNYQSAFSVGQRAAAGDSQISRIGYNKTCANVGWHDVHVFNGVANNRTYLWETTVIGRQTAGTAGAVGNTFAYKFTGAVTVNGSGVGATLGTVTRTLIGRTAGMTGDGLTTGPRLSELGSALYNADIAIRYDGEADTTFYIVTYSTVQELA